MNFGAGLIIYFGLGSRGMTLAARRALLRQHYLKRMPPCSFVFEMWDEVEVCAVATFGIPPSRHLQKSVCPSNPANVIEFNRLWVADKMPKNTASFFVSRALKRLPARIVVSYADSAVGHHGGVYQALNFFCAGVTDAERKTPRFDYVPVDRQTLSFDYALAITKHTRDAFRGGEFERVRRKPKFKFWTVTGNKKEKREMRRACGWPSLPKEHAS